MVDTETLEQIAVWELQTQIQVLTHKLKYINMQRKRLRGQAPFIKRAINDAEKLGTLRGILHADQLNKLIDEVCDE